MAGDAGMYPGAKKRADAKIKPALMHLQQLEIKQRIPELVQAVQNSHDGGLVRLVRAERRDAVFTFGRIYRNRNAVEIIKPAGIQLTEHAYQIYSVRVRDTFAVLKILKHRKRFLFSGLTGKQLSARQNRQRIPADACRNPRGYKHILNIA